jgi:uncharacterized membrane protein YhaH (DUF805 family)
MVLTLQSTFWACWGAVFTLALILLGVAAIKGRPLAWDCIGWGLGLLVLLAAMAALATGRLF